MPGVATRIAIAIMASLMVSAQNQANARDADCTRVESAWDRCPCVLDSCGGPFQMDSRTVFRMDRRMMIDTVVPEKTVGPRSISSAGERSRHYQQQGVIRKLKGDDGCNKKNASRRY